MWFPRWLYVGLPFLASLAALRAQAPRVNALSNGGFESPTRTVDNLWDGVDGDGYLATPTYSAWVLTEGAALGNLPMPPSVAVADLNGDGKPDLLAASPTGYYFYYQNRGTATEPKFRDAEVLPIFLSSSLAPRDYYHAFLQDRDTDRYCPRIAVADWRKRGVLDLLVGNFLGEFLFVPNGGTARQPVFAQPAAVDKSLIQTDDRNRLWGNLFAPVAADWNNDGKLDVITGEGTYSANSIRLLENIGGETPKFSNARRSVIAYGDGREHLIPTVADFNGDGFPDLLVADRSGEIGVYLNPGAPKPGVELKRVSTVSFGGTSRLPGLVAPCAADLNGDGLFDLVMGLPSGRIAVAYNTGSRTEPSFGAWQELKGEDRLKRTVRTPPDWECYTSAELGNGPAYFAVVNAQDDSGSEPPEGANCIKAGSWAPAGGGIFAYPDTGIPQALQHYYLVHPLRLQINKPYTIRFKMKGAGMEKARWGFDYFEDSFTGALKMERGDRGEGVREGGHVQEHVELYTDFTPGSGWATVEKTLTARFKNAALKDRTEMNGHLVIDFYARNLSSVLYLDDFQVFPQ